MARYLKEARALFLHIPRTGGVFVNSVIDGLEINHSVWRGRFVVRSAKEHSLYGHYRNKDNAYVEFAFTFVRHPLNYYEALWNYFVGLNNHRTKKVHMYAHGWDWHCLSEPAQAFLRSDSFDKWLRRMVKKSPCYVTRLYEWFCGPENGEIVDWIGRNETLCSDLESILSFLGYQEHLNKRSIFDFPYVNGSRSRADLSWDPGIRREMIHLENRAISRFYPSHYEDKERFTNRMTNPKNPQQRKHRLISDDYSCRD